MIHINFGLGLNFTYNIYNLNNTNAGISSGIISKRNNLIATIDFSEGFQVKYSGNGYTFTLIIT